MEIHIFLLVNMCIGLCCGLKEVRIQTPIAVKRGETASLHCWYDTEGDPLYIVKWYKAGREFYRYVPKDTPTTKSFPVGSLKVKESESNATQVTLLNMEPDAGGSYSCEVSADAPSFQTAVVYATLNIAELPSERPFISGLRRKYNIQDVLRLNCTSGRSKPAANLTWYINDKQPHESYVRTYNNLVSESYDYQTSRIGLQFLVTHDHFVRSKMKIRCSASIYDIYWQSTEVSAEEERPRMVNSDPTATIIGVNYIQPPPNFQTGQKRPDGQLDVKVLGSSVTQMEPPVRILLQLMTLLHFFVH